MLAAIVSLLGIQLGLGNLTALAVGAIAFVWFCNGLREWLALGPIAGVVFLPFVLALLWYLAIAILGFARARPATAAPPPPGAPPAPSG